ncbi:hypothetical protein HND97_16355 [Vibrio cholerae]|nr:hypothetical protein HND97_16355 [Vibrio cholerae]
MKLTSDIVRLVEQCRSEIQNLVLEQIIETVTQEALTTTQEGLDILSSHGHVNDVEVLEFSVDDIDSQWLKIKELAMLIVHWFRDQEAILETTMARLWMKISSQFYGAYTFGQFQ